MHRSRLSPRRLATLATCVVAVAVVTGACSASGDDDQAAEPAPAMSIPADLDMSATASSAKDDEAPSGQEKPTEDPSPSPEADDGERVDAERCTDLQQAWAASNRALVNLSAQHPRALVESIRTAEEATTSVEPTEGVADAWTARSDYLGSVVAAFEGVDSDDADAVSSAFADAVGGDDTQAFNDAAQEITDYLDATCSDR